METEAQDHPTRIYKIQNITKVYLTPELQVIFYICSALWKLSTIKGLIIRFCLLGYVTMREEGRVNIFILGSESFYYGPVEF